MEHGLAAPSERRRLAAVLAADMVGYSRLMETDERGTMARHRSYLEHLIEPSVATHGGRIVKTTGDGLLAEFASIVDAVDCAAVIQRALAAGEEAMGEDRRIRFRIGINLGDIVCEGDDIFGDGVNIAARLESIAEPGGIVISGTAFDHLKRKVDVGYEYLGEKHVKNIAEPVRAYRVLMEPGAAGTVIGAGPLLRHRARLTAVGILILVMAGSGAAWLKPWSHGLETASVDRMAYPLPDRPSIAVLPFDNFSDDPSQIYFADGITEDLITDLSKISGLFVIARNSTFAYKGRPVEIRQVAEDLGVRYVLEGSVRRAGDRIRINAQLIDSTTGGHLWAERYDGTLNDVFVLQDAVTKEIVSALAVNLTPYEEAQQQSRYTQNSEAYEAFLKGWDHYQRLSAADFVAAIPHFERAVELDPNYGQAYAALAALYWKTFRQGISWSSTVNPDAGRQHSSLIATQEKARQYLTRAMINPSPLAHQVASAALLHFRQFDEALVEADKATALNPNDSGGYAATAWAKLYLGHPEEALEAVDRALRLDPLQPGSYALVRGMILLTRGEYRKAVEVLTSLNAQRPEYRDVNLPLAVAQAYLGEIDAAKAAVTRYIELEIQYGTTMSDIVGWWPFKRERDFRHFAGGLIKAGLGSEEELDERVRILRLGGTLE